jgi:hypothetical protein
MADKKKPLVGLAEQLIGIVDGGSAARTGNGSGTSANLTEAVSGQVEDLLGVSKDSPTSASPSDSHFVRSLATGEDLTAGADKLAADLVRDSEIGVENTGDLIGRDRDKLTEDDNGQGEFSSKWDWRRDATERAGG